MNPFVAAYYGNRSFAYLKTECFGSALQDAGQALSLDRGYIKVSNFTVVILIFFFIMQNVLGVMIGFRLLNYSNMYHVMIKSRIESWSHCGVFLMGKSFEVEK